MLNSVTNALRMVDYLVEQKSGGVTEMANALDLSPGAAHRLVTTLVGAGFVDQDEQTKRYRASIKILELANTLRDQFEFLELAREHLLGLAVRTEETVNLGVLRDGRITYVDRVVSNQPVAVEVQKGSVAPAYCTGLGKAILAFSDPALQEDYLGKLPDMASSDDRAVPGAGKLKAELKDVAAKGYAEDVGEFSPEIRCVAAPILNDRGFAVAAVSVTGPLSRVSTKVETLTPMVEIAAKELTIVVRALGDENIRF